MSAPLCDCMVDLQEEAKQVLMIGKGIDDFDDKLQHKTKKEKYHFLGLVSQQQVILPVAGSRLQLQWVDFTLTTNRSKV